MVLLAWAGCLALVTGVSYVVPCIEVEKKQIQ